MLCTIEFNSIAIAKETLRLRMGVATDNGTLAINTDKFTGRSSKDGFLVEDDYTKYRVWYSKG